MTSQNAELIAQLNTLLRLTSTEAATARARVTQASTEATRTELTENAHNSDKRAAALKQAVIDLGGAPDVVGVALGRAAAATKLPLEQTIPITEALLADLALEHQLFDRARLVKVLAHDADASDLVALAERLEDAHGETIMWLFKVLAETAIGGPAALTPTTVQSAAATARHAATFASSATATGVNRAVATVTTLADRVQDTTSTAVGRQIGRVRSLATSAKKVVVSGRDATLAETEKQATSRGNTSAAHAVHDLRADLGTVDASDLPITSYDTLTARDAAAAVHKLRTAEQIRTVLAYEQAHKARVQVTDAATKRIAQLAEQLVNS